MHVSAYSVEHSHEYADATVVIDEREAVLEEAGEVIHALAHGVITEDHLIELGTALTDGLAPRTGRTVFKTVGIPCRTGRSPTCSLSYA
ncbi:hypothetical protein [Nonomuraea sp. NPDC049141]|uniref:hypothetical protein n=1 Tax=unclassified Nonomuraea TaxID=2593643 RepID=UPI003408D955